MNNNYQGILYHNAELTIPEIAPEKCIGDSSLNQTRRAVLGLNEILLNFESGDIFKNRTPLEAGRDDLILTYYPLMTKWTYECMGDLPFKQNITNEYLNSQIYQAFVIEAREEIADIYKNFENKGYTINPFIPLFFKGNVYIDPNTFEPEIRFHTVFLANVK